MKKIFLIFTLFFSVIVLCANEVKTIESYITVSNNDAEEHPDGNVELVSSDLEMTEEIDIQTIGIRFSNLKIPQNAIITKAYIQFHVDEVSFGECLLNIYIEDSSDPKLFLNTPFNISSRKRVDSSIRWRPPAWQKIYEAGKAQRTPELKNLVQKIVDKKDWRPGNSMAFIIRGYGKRVAIAYQEKEHKTEKNLAPMLHIEYTLTDESDGNLTINRIDENTKPISNGLIISEILAINSNTNLDEDTKKFSDWIELYNKTNQTINIGGFYLSNDIQNPKKFKFPPNTIIKPFGYLLVWADNQAYLNGYDMRKKRSSLDSNHSAENSTSIHTNFKLAKKGLVLLLDKNGTLIDKFVYKKQKANISCIKEGNKTLFAIPTPNQKNAHGYPKPKKTQKPSFSKESGFYRGCQKVELKHNKHAKIYYTLDGSIPTTASTQYTKPITICETSVIRARALEKGKFFSNIVNHTYLIDENISLPVVSVAIDKKYLYDETIGIATNYEEHWIRPGAVEYFQDKKSIFSTNAGIKINGNHTRAYPQKSFAVYFKKKYGKKFIEYPLFRDKPHIKKIKSFILRNSGTNWGHSLIREGIIHRIVKENMDIDFQSYHPVIMLLNGQYWGIYNIREKMNKDYIETNYHIKSSDIDLIENDKIPAEGDMDDFYDLMDYIKTHDLSDESNFNKIKEKIDMTEFINHIITESFSGNSSIHHNIKRWKNKSQTGKWRTLLFDLDRGFNNPEAYVLGYVADCHPTSSIFTHLLQNREFVYQFASLYFSHLNTTFKTKRVDRFITQAKEEIAPEIKRHFKKWSKDFDGNSVSIKTWKNYIDKIYQFSSQRNRFVRENLKKSLNLKGSPKLTIKKVEHGTIYLDGIKLVENFEGEYFNDAKVRLKAVADSGYRFEKWSNGNSSQEITININQDNNISVIFIKN